jgi:hypothetical protein
MAATADADMTKRHRAAYVSAADPGRLQPDIFGDLDDVELPPCLSREGGGGGEAVDLLDADPGIREGRADDLGVDLVGMDVRGLAPRRFIGADDAGGSTRKVFVRFHPIALHWMLLSFLREARYPKNKAPSSTGMVTSVATAETAGVMPLRSNE